MEPELSPKTHVRLFVFLFLILVIALGLAWVYKDKIPFLSKPDAVTEEKPIVNVDSIAMVDIEADNNPRIKGSYPRFTNASDAFNKKIADFVKKSVDDFIREEAETWKAQLDTANAKERAELEKAGPRTSFSITTNVVENSSTNISLLLSTDVYLGGAHGLQVLTSFNYDIAKKREVVLKDLFPGNDRYLETISQVAREQLAAKFREDFGRDDIEDEAEREKYFQENVMGWITEGTEPSLESFGTFTFTEKEITIHFQEYQVGPYAIGLQRVTIPR